MEGVQVIAFPATTSSTRALAPPLCVDLCGTLVLSDLLLESLLLLIKRNPLYVFLFPLWLLRGRAVLEAEAAARVMFDPERLPYDLELIRWLAAEHSSGRSLWLCTATNHRSADRVASHLGIFEGVIASGPTMTLAATAQAALLVSRFGERGFDYCGNKWRNIAIWKIARGAIVVRGGSRLQRGAARHTPVLLVFPPRAKRLRAIIRALRLHQWAKNVLILLPMLAADRAGHAVGSRAGLLAVAVFCLCASSVYVLNDLLDLEADRAHPRKSSRPFAAGDVSLRIGFLLALSLLGAALLIAAFLPESFQLALATYYTLTLVYSLALKGIVVIDTVVLAGLYVLRVIAGGVAESVSLSFWILLFSMFLFLSLAFVKRYAELDVLRRQRCLRAAGRSYDVADLPILQSLGTAAGYMSVLVLALYINSPEIEALYTRPRMIWALCLLLLCWISRVWVMAQRGQMHDDPVVFALKDRISLVLGLLGALTVALAI